MEILIKNVNDILDTIVGKYDLKLNSLVDYVFILVSNYYDKKFSKKYIFKDIIKQIICESYPNLCGDRYNNFIVNDNSHLVDYLKTIPQFEQRTPGWFKMKENSVGASESAIIFGKSVFSNRRKLLLKKSGFKEKWIPNPACTHGTKYEPIVQLLYQNKNMVELFEFGSLVHKKYPMISASPDGITTEGVMVEIKVPYRRIITGIPPIYYWFQMQQQMEVCNLDRVDFGECNISEYLNIKEFIKDTNNKEDPNACINNEGNIKNVIIEYFKKNDIGELIIDWIYPDKFLKIDEIPNWVSDIKKQLKEGNDTIFSRDIYFKINKYSSTEIWRDREWWSLNYKEYLKFWEEVEHYREIGNESLMPKPRKPRKNRVKYLIVEEEEY